MLASQAELDAEGVYRPYRLAELPYPWRLEQSHGMLVGTTGTGKTVALSALVDQIRERDHRAVIFDLTGTFVERFYEERRDTILNPLDARCPQWSIFSECDSEAEFTTVWEALIPHDGGTSEPFWVQASRMLGIETSTKLKREGRGNNHALYTELMTADLRHVHKLVENTLADPITAPEAARMAESVRAVLNTNAKALRLLPRTGPTFSVKQWMLGDCAPGSILFLSSRYVDMSVNKILLTTWMDSALNTLMTMSRSRDVRMWFLVDELGALHRLNALDKGLQTARNYGGAIMLGLHSFARLEEVYGPKGATNLASLARTKLILATSDRQTATWSSDFIGHRQFRDIEENHSYGASSVRDAATLTQRRYLEPLVLPDEITDLPALHGIIKFPEGFPAARVELKIVDYPTVARGFVQRAVERSDEWTAPAPPPAAIGPAADGNDGATGGTGDGGAGPAVDLPEPGAAGAVGDQPKHEAATGTIGTEPQPLQPLLPLNPILQPVERTNPTSRASRIGRTKAGSGGEPLSELPGLRARKLPEVHVGENAAGDPLRPKMISPPPPDQVEKDLHTAFVEEPRGDPPSSIDDDLGIGD
jgi:type IV conjugative transfer system coupling protein TraD